MWAPFWEYNQDDDGAHSINIELSNLEMAVPPLQQIHQLGIHICQKKKKNRKKGSNLFSGCNHSVDV